jgi:hypothetical protein
MKMHYTNGRQVERRHNRMVCVGDVVHQLMDNQLSPRQEAFDVIDELWRQLLPAEIVRHSKIAEFSGGQLKVQVGAASYMYELQLCSSGLLSEIQRLCPKVRVKEIKVVLA